MIRLVAIAVLLHTAFARADVVLHDDDDVPPLRGNYPTVPPPPPPPADPLELPRLRVDGGLGVAGGDGPTAFAMRGHVGGSLWVVDRADGDAWHPALRLSAGLSLGVDVRSEHQYYTAAPFAELGLAMVRGNDDRDNSKQVTVFGRIEPRFLAGELETGGARLGVGITLHGFGGLSADSDCHGEDKSDCELGHLFLDLIGAPVLAVINARSFELATDIGSDGTHEYALLLGFGV